MGFVVAPSNIGPSTSELPGEFKVAYGDYPNSAQVLVRYFGEEFREGSIKATLNKETKDMFVDVVGVSDPQEGIGTALYQRAISELGGDVKSISGRLMKDNLDIFRTKGLEKTPAYKIRKALGFTKVDAVNDLGEQGIYLKMSKEGP